MANSVWISPFGFSFDGSSVNFPSTVNITGDLNVSGIMTSVGETRGLNLRASSAGFVYFNARTNLNAPADGQLNLTIAATTTGVGIDVATDAVLKVRTRAQTGYATVDCLGLKASGVAGANFGPAAIASITIVNGIVTAAS